MGSQEMRQNRKLNEITEKWHSKCIQIDALNSKKNKTPFPFEILIEHTKFYPTFKEETDTTMELTIHNCINTTWTFISIHSLFLSFTFRCGVCVKRILFIDLLCFL